MTLFHNGNKINCYCNFRLCPPRGQGAVTVDVLAAIVTVDLFYHGARLLSPR
jgi:hypothetical protein